MSVAGGSDRCGTYRVRCGPVRGSCRYVRGGSDKRGERAAVVLLLADTYLLSYTDSKAAQCVWARPHLHDTRVAFMQYTQLLKVHPRNMYHKETTDS